MGCSDFARHYYRNRGYFLFLQVLRWFTSLGSLPPAYWIQRVVPWFFHGGFPHSEIPGSMPACGSPGLIAACHVLHRLLLPRHPPCALSSLTIKFTRRSGLLRTSARISQPWICSSRLRSGPAHRRTDISEDTPADLSALKKFTQPCRLPNRFSCQTSSSSRRGGKV